jgi:hypothetical protein
VPDDWKKPERMVQDWAKLGFIVVEKATGRLVEDERSI